MKEKENNDIKLSETEKVNAYMQNLKHPLVEEIQALRQIILKTDKTYDFNLKTYENIAQLTTTKSNAFQTSLK